MTTLAIHYARVIDPKLGLDGLMDIVVVDGRIARIGPNEAEMVIEAERIDASGLTVTPGFVDLHCHLREPGFEQKETIATGTSAAAKGGFTTVCAMPNTDPPLDSQATAESVLHQIEQSALVRVLPIGCVTRGRAGNELAPAAELVESGVVAISDDGDAVANTALMQAALSYSSLFALPVVQHAEDPALVANGQIHEGWVSTRLGLRGRPSSAEEILVARDIALAEVTGGHLHLAHISTSGSVALIAAAKDRGIHVTAEVTPHHLTLTHEIVAFDGQSPAIQYDTSAKVNPPLREPQDLEILTEAVARGTVDAIATDHAPHSKSDKEIEFDLAAPGISMLETAFGLAMKRVHDGSLNLSTLIKTLTSGPVDSWSLERRTNTPGLGTLSPGSPADIAIIDPDLLWEVDTREFLSKGKNTPLDGWELKGKVLATLFNVEPVYVGSEMSSRLRLNYEGGR